MSTDATLLLGAMAVSLVVFGRFFTWRNVYCVTNSDYYATLWRQRLSLASACIISILLAVTQGGIITIAPAISLTLFTFFFDLMETKRMRKKVEELKHGQLLT